MFLKVRYRQLFLFLILQLYNINSQNEIKSNVRVIYKLKPSSLKHLDAPDLQVTSFANNTEADDFYAIHKDRFDIFVLDEKLSLKSLRKSRDSLMSLQYYLDTLSIKTSWKISQGFNVTIAIIDSGIDSNNTEYNSNIKSQGYNYGYICCENLINCMDSCMCTAKSNESMSIPIDLDGHGTQIAGMLCANKGNGGIVGISPDIKIIPLKITDCFGDVWASSVVSAIKYAISKKVQIIATSFGSNYPYDFSPKENASDSESALIKLYTEIISEARNSGIVVVSSAGNEHINLDNLYAKGYSYSPCLIGMSLDNVICVGSTYKNKTIAYFSNYGKAVHTWAPGEQIYTTDLKNKYVYVDGTSFSSPMVSGIVALGISLAKKMKKNLSPALIRQLIINSTKNNLLNSSLFLIKISKL